MKTEELKTALMAFAGELLTEETSGVYKWELHEQAAAQTKAQELCALLEPEKVERFAALCVPQVNASQRKADTGERMRCTRSQGSRLGFRMARKGAQNIERGMCQILGIKDYPGRTVLRECARHLAADSFLPDANA
jgi:hypothetical protein